MFTDMFSMENNILIFIQLNYKLTPIKEKKPLKFINKNKFSFYVGKEN